MRLKTYYKGYTNYSLRDFTVKVEDTCSTAELSINLPTFKDHYTISEPAIIEHIDPSLIISSETDVACPALVIKIVNSDDESELDKSIFSYDNTKSDDFKVFTTDNSNVGTYRLRLKTYYTGYINYSTRDFEINFDAKVNTPPSFDDFSKTTVT